jgi:predicted XRE-type DNA-binding protein
MPNADNIPVIEGSGNIFADLGFDDPEALQMKAELTRQIYHRVTALGLTQREAGKRLGLKQPDVSKLMQGRFTGFSADRLLAVLNALEVDVDIVLRPHSKHNGHRGIVRVVEAPA